MFSAPSVADAQSAGTDRKGGAMELHPLVYHEWRDDHALSRRSLIWIHEHADPDDPHPLVTAVQQLRDERVDRLQ